MAVVHEPSDKQGNSTASRAWPLHVRRGRKGSLFGAPRQKLASQGQWTGFKLQGFKRRT